MSGVSGHGGAWGRPGRWPQSRQLLPLPTSDFYCNDSASQTVSDGLACQEVGPSAIVMDGLQRSLWENALWGGITQGQAPLPVGCWGHRRPEVTQLWGSLAY